MNKSLLSGALGALIIFISGPANAALIVDTGPGGESTAGGISLNSNQYLGAQFNVGAATIVTGIEGWIDDNGTGDGTIAIYSNGNGLPDNELYSTTFSSARIGPDTAAWVGTSGLSWDLDAGTYWVAFEVRTGQTLFSYMPGGTSNPLQNEAFIDFTSGGSGAWRINQNMDIGVHISAVPIPAAIWLFGSGLLVFFGVTKGGKA